MVSFVIGWKDFDMVNKDCSLSPRHHTPYSVISFTAMLQHKQPG